MAGDAYVQAKKFAAIALYNKDRKILLQHRSEDAPRLPGYWGFFGGGLEDGETPEDALKRELFEEVEYTVRDPKLFLKREYLSLYNDVIQMHLYVERYDESQPIILHEGQGYGWFTIDEALKLKITEHRREDLERIREYLKSIKVK